MIRAYGRLLALCLAKNREKEGVVKRTLIARHWLIVLVVLLAIFLVACERPLRDLEETPTSEAPLSTPADQLLIPTPEIPQPSGSDLPLTGEVGGQEAQTTEEPAAVDAGQNPQPTTYVVQAGDTLGAIAQQNNITVEELAAANGITNVDSLEIGQTLLIPVSGTQTQQPTTATEPPPTQSTEPDTQPGSEIIHTVQAGDNLFRIGLRYGFTAEELAAYNGIPDPRYIDVGQQIRIPPG